MLIQDKEVLDCCQDPHALMWSLLEEKDFCVAVGVINEEGRREIVGTCAEFTTQVGSKVAFLTSPIDGNRRLVSKGGIVACIRERVCLLFRYGLLSDPCNFSRVLMLEGCAV